MSYQFFVVSTTFFAVACQARGIKAKGTNRLNKLLRKAGPVVGGGGGGWAEDANQTAGQHEQHFPRPP